MKEAPPALQAEPAKSSCPDRVKSNRRPGGKDYGLARCFAALGKVEPAVRAPDRSHPEGDVRLLHAHPGHGPGSDQIEEHAGQICQESEDWNDKMLEAIEHVVLPERHDGEDARRHVQQEGPEVADQGYDQQSVRQLRVGIGAEYSKAVPDVVLRSEEH